MEDVDKTIKKALDFLCVVQSSCDSQRRVLEQLLKEEFLNFSDKWKKNALEAQQENARVEMKKQIDDVESLTEEFENNLDVELTQAEILLKKARKLREDFKGHFVSDEENFAVHCKPSHQSFLTTKQGMKLNQFTAVNGLCTSKSEPVLSHVSPQGQSSIKRPQSSLSVKSVKKVSGNKMSVTGEKTSNNQPATVITKHELSTYRYLQHSTAQKGTISTNLKLKGPSHCDQGKNGSGDHKALKKTMCMKLDDVSLQDKRKKPAMKDFSHAIEVNALENMTLKPSFFHCSWYPFINTSNTVRLSLQLTCSSSKELQHVYTLYHQIQETLFWLDLFSVLGKALHIQSTDSHNQNVCIIRSYLKSVFHEHMQRTPIILPPDASS